MDIQAMKEIKIADDHFHCANNLHDINYDIFHCTLYLIICVFIAFLRNISRVDFNDNGKLFQSEKIFHQ